MISLKFCLSLPIDRWGLIWGKSGKTPFPHKLWEFMIYRSPDVISFEFSWKTLQDHVGLDRLDIDLSLLGYNAEFLIYDDRH